MDTKRMRATQVSLVIVVLAMTVVAGELRFRHQLPDRTLIGVLLIMSELTTIVVVLDFRLKRKPPE